jgi:hypothetical protein
MATLSDLPALQNTDESYSKILEIQSHPSYTLVSVTINKNINSNINILELIRYIIYFSMEKEKNLIPQIICTKQLQLLKNWIPKKEGFDQ